MLMRAVALLFTCCLCAGERRRVQSETAGRQDDDFAIVESQNAQSLVQLVQSTLTPVDNLKSDFLAILRKEPKWKNYAKYFMVFDHTGNQLYGVQPAKWLCQLLRKMASTFSVKDLKIDFKEDHQIQSAWKNGKQKKQIHYPMKTVLAQWSVKLDIKNSGTDPIEIEGEILFEFAPNAKIAIARLTDCFVNGVQLALWPEVDNNQTVKESMLKFREWIEDVKTLTEKEAYESVYQVGTMPSEELATVQSTLKKDFANIFLKEPSWNIYADNLTITDHTKAEFKGLASGQNALYLLRNLKKQFVVRDHIVHFMELSGQCSSYSNGKLTGKTQIPYSLVENQKGSILAAEWRVTLAEKKGLAFWKNGYPILIQGRSLFSADVIDDAIKIDRASIDGLWVNGEELVWPELDPLTPLSDELENRLMSIKDWKDAMKPSEPEPDLESEESEAA